MTEQAEQAAPVEAAVQADAPKWAPEVESLARDWGWKAPDEWKGDLPEGYIDNPERFVQRFEKLPPVQKLQKEVEDVRKASTESLRRIEEVTARTVQRERERHAAELAKIKADKVAAVEVGDVQAFKALDAQEDKLRKEMQPVDEPKPSAVPDVHRVAIENWAVERPWFKKDAVKTQAAATFYGEAQADGLTDPAAILKFVDRRMGETFADMAPKQPRDAAVEGGLTLSTGVKAGTFDTLPRDAKDAFQRFVQRGVVEDTKEARATWAEDYNAA